MVDGTVVEDPVVGGTVVYDPVVGGTVVVIRWYVERLLMVLC